MGEEKVLYSVKMRSSLGGAHGVGGQHISGAERIVTKNSVEQEMISMLHRACLLYTSPSPRDTR